MTLPLFSSLIPFPRPFLLHSNNLYLVDIMINDFLMGFSLLCVCVEYLLFVCKGSTKDMSNSANIILSVDFVEREISINFDMAYDLMKRGNEGRKSG